jgi:hypothetical protein
VEQRRASTIPDMASNFWKVVSQMVSVSLNIVFEFWTKSSSENFRVVPTFFRSEIKNCVQTHWNHLGNSFSKIRCHILVIVMPSGAPQWNFNKNYSLPVPVLLHSFWCLVWGRLFVLKSANFVAKRTNRTAMCVWIKPSEPRQLENESFINVSAQIKW